MSESLNVLEPEPSDPTAPPATAPAPAPTTEPRQVDPNALAQKAFQTSILISAVRCTLTYVVLPFVTPLLSFAPGVGPWLGIVIAVVAIVANLASIRRFQRSGHRHRWAMSAINVAMIGLVSWLLVRDVMTLVG